MGMTHVVGVVVVALLAAARCACSASPWPHRPDRAATILSEAGGAETDPATLLAAVLEDLSNTTTLSLLSRALADSQPRQSLLFAQLALWQAPLSREAVQANAAALTGLQTAFSHHPDGRKGAQPRSDRVRDQLVAFRGTALNMEPGTLRACGVQFARAKDMPQALVHFNAAFLLADECAGDLGVALACSFPANCPESPPHDFVQSVRNTDLKRTALYAAKVLRWVESVQSAYSGRKIQTAKYLAMADAQLRRLGQGGAAAVPPVDRSTPPPTTLLNVMLPRCDEAWCSEFVPIRLFVLGYVLAVVGDLQGAAVYLHRAVRADPTQPLFVLGYSTVLSRLGLGTKACEMLGDVRTDSGPVGKVVSSRVKECRNAARRPTSIADEFFTAPHLDGTASAKDATGEYDEQGIVRRAFEAEGDLVETPHAFATAVLQHSNEHHSLLDKPALSNVRALVLLIPPNLGLGNRLLSVVSAFVLAMITRRALLVQWPSDLPPLRRLFRLPPGLLWDYSDYVRGLSPSDLDALPFLSRSFSFGEEVEKQKQLSVLACEHLGNAFGDTPFVHLSTNMWLVPVLLANRHHARSLRQLFGVAGGKEAAPFAIAARYLLHPQDDIGEAVSLFAQQHFHVAGELKVGLHIRGGTDLPQDKTRRTLAFHSGSAAVQSFVNGMVDCVGEAIAHSLQAHHKHVTVFVAADSLESKQMAVARINAMSIKGVRVKGVFYDAPVDRLSTAGSVGAVIDWWLLSLCDAIVRPQWTTFSITAAALNQVPSFKFEQSCLDVCSPVTRLEPRLGTVLAHFADGGNADCFVGKGRGLVREMGDAFYPQNCNA